MTPLIESFFNTNYFRIKIINHFTDYIKLTKRLHIIQSLIKQLNFYLFREIFKLFQK